MPPVEHAVIAAAGLGSRLGLGRPKCLLEIDEQSLLERQLHLLDSVPDVRIVVGFDAEAVIAAARPIRPDVIFVRNPAFRSTSTLVSYAIGAAGLTDNCLFMDADILFEPRSFRDFLRACENTDLLIGITHAKTSDAVYTQMDGNKVAGFSRLNPTPWEWANLCWLPPKYCESGSGAVFERLSDSLPLASHVIQSFEIDTPEDHRRALEQCHFA
jgi:choline kinase